MNAKKKTDKRKAHGPAAEAAMSKDMAAKESRKDMSSRNDGPGQDGKATSFGSGKPKAGIKDSGIKASGFAFGKENYRLLLIGLAFIVAGFLLMIGGGSEDRTEFSYDIFNFRRLTLAPILILTGYVIEIFAIMKKPKD